MTEKVLLKRNWILLALMLTMMLAAMDTTIVSTAIPMIVADLGGFNKFSWVFSIYLLAQTVTIPVYGKLSDTFGRKTILITGIIIFLVGSAASAASWNIGSLILFRGIQGLGAGSIMATVNTIAGDIYSVKERAKIQGWLSSIWGISAIIGPALGGALAGYVDWRWIFLINLPVGTLSIILLIIHFKEKVKHEYSYIDYKGAVLILFTIGLFIIFLLEGGVSWPWISYPSVVIFIAVLVLALFTFKIEKKAKNPIMPGWLWKNKTFAFTNLAMVAMGIVMMGPETFLPTFTQTSLSLGIIASGFVLASMSIGWPTASALSGRLYLKIGFRNTSLVGTIIVIISCAGFLLIPAPQPIWLIVLDQVLLGVGFGLLSTPSLVGIQSIVSWQKRGVVTGANVFSRNLGQSLGASIFGAIFNASFISQMKNAPGNLSVQNKNVLDMLHDPAISESSKKILRQAINIATQHIYIGLSIFAIGTFLFIYLVPKNYKQLNTD